MFHLTKQIISTPNEDKITVTRLKKRRAPTGVYVSAAKVWVPNGPIECQGKATDQPEFNCYGIVYTLPSYPDPIGIVVNLD